MRILTISNLYPPTVIGGYETSCAQVVDALRARAHDVHVLTSVPKEVVPALPHVARSLRIPDVFSADRPHVRSNFWELESNLIDSGNIYALLEVVREFEPDVCHLWNLVGIGGAALVGTLEYLGVPWLWHLGDAVPAQLCIYQGSVQPLAHEMSRRLTGQFQAVGQGLVNEIEQVVSLGRRVRLLPNWVLDPTEPLDRAFFDGSVLRIVFAGQLNEHKGVYLLLEAARLLRESGHTNFTIDFFGRGEQESVTDRIVAADLSEVVTLHGWVPQAELRARLGGYDVFAFPTWAREPFALAPLEAAVEGCVPLISTPSGPAEWLIDGVDCLKARREATAFAGVLAEVLDGRIQLAPIARRSAAVVRRDFTLSRVIPLIEKELAESARHRRAPSGDHATVYEMALVAEVLLRTASAG